MVMRTVPIPITSIAHSATTGQTATDHHSNVTDHGRSHAHSDADDGQTLSPVNFNVGAGGVAFPAVEVPVAGANVLDDYEEGEWTPGVEFGGASVGMTLGTQVGRYTKDGNVVTCTASIFFSAKGSSAGSARITGLPFTSSDVGSLTTGVTLELDVITFANQFMARVSNNATGIDLLEVTEAGARTALTEGNFADTSIIISISVSYRV